MTVTNNIPLEVTLVVPHILQARYASAPDPAAARQLPALQRYLSRSNRVSTAAANFTDLLFELFPVKVTEVSLASTHDKPVAALNCFLQQEIKANHWYMRADPVCILPNRDHLELLGNRFLNIEPDEAQQFIEAINRVYTDTDWTLRSINASRWVIEQEQPINVSTTALNDAIGADMNRCLPRGPDARRWQALMNELQMMLHTHPVNQQRTVKGLYPVNSLWIWGSGQLPVSIQHEGQQCYTQCWSSSARALALAKLCDVRRRDIPLTGAEWLKQTDQHGQHLVVFDEPDTAEVLADPEYGWLALTEFEENWMRTLMTALHEGKINHLSLVSDQGKSYHLTRAMDKRWWRRQKLAF